jgi:hypothetical protein
MEIDDRKNIDNLVEELKARYLIDDNMQLDRLIADYNILFIGEERVYNFAGWNGNNPYIHAGKTPFRVFDEHNLYHELGHIILKTDSEEIANYFARSFAEYSLVSYIAAAAYRWIKNPIEMCKYILNPKSYSHNIMAKIIQEKEAFNN